MNIVEKIKNHLEKRLFCVIERKVGKSTIERSRGYVVNFSEKFILLQEVDDFEVRGYSIFTVDSVDAIRFNNQDKYYDKIMQLEGLKDKVCNKYKIDLSSWPMIFKSIKKLGFKVIIENENPEDDSFNIGPIVRVNNTSVWIKYFDPSGFIDDETTEITWDSITIIQFDDRYANILGKYLRERKLKK